MSAENTNEDNDAQDRIILFSAAYIVGAICAAIAVGGDAGWATLAAFAFAVCVYTAHRTYAANKR